MSKVQTLRAFVQQRLSAAAEEIFELFERTIAEYEEELCGQRKLLDAVFKPEVRFHRADTQLLLTEEAVHPEQLDQEDPPEPPHIKEEWRASLDQEDPPEPPHIKEEQEEVWTNQEGEQLEEADITKFTFSPVPVKSEDHEEKPQKAEADHHQTSGFADTETGDSCDWEETREPQSGSNPLQNYAVFIGSQECNSGKTSRSSSECATGFDHKEHLQEDRVQTEENQFSCSVCGKRYANKKSLRSHMRLHSEGKRFSCSVCKKTFLWKGDLVKHMRIHTGEKPFSCSVCGKRYPSNNSLLSHLKLHSEGKRFSCSVCKKTFRWRGDVVTHMRIHTGEKPFSCSVCGKRFGGKGNLRRHLAVHTGEKRFTCSVCGKGFIESSQLNSHLRVHTGEKPFTCSVCKASFSHKISLTKHMTIHTGEKQFC